MPVIEKLMRDGYRVWFDEGIDPGTEWPEYIASHVSGCGVFIPFISRNYLDSTNCLDELNHAHDKPRLLIYLEEVDLPEGQQMRNGRYQAIYKFRYKRDDDFYSRFYGAAILEECLSRGANDDHGGQGGSSGGRRASSRYSSDGESSSARYSSDGESSSARYYSEGGSGSARNSSGGREPYRNPDTTRNTGKRYSYEYADSHRAKTDVRKLLTRLFMAAVLIYTVYTVVNVGGNLFGSSGNDTDSVSKKGYILSLEAIPDEGMESMLSELEDSFYATVASDWSTDVVSVKGFDCIGVYFLAEKSNESPHNLIYLVCQVNVEYFKESSAGFTDAMTTYYYYGGYQNLMLLEDGTLSVDYDTLITPTESFTELGLTYLGYQSLDDMYTDLVTVNIDDYTCESSVEDEDFGYELTGLTDVYCVPEDAKEYNGHYYKLYAISDMTWTTAEEQCRLRGGHLVTVTSQEENNFIKIQVIESGSSAYWGGAYYDVSEQWLWVTDEEMEYTDWLTSASSVSNPYLLVNAGGWLRCPDDGEGGYGIITGSNGYHAGSWGYICEWDSADLSEEEDETEAEAEE